MCYCICDWSSVRCAAVYLRTTKPARESQVRNPFISFVKSHVASYISWIKDLCAFTSLHLRSSWRFQPLLCFLFFSSLSILFAFLQPHQVASCFVFLPLSPVSPFPPVRAGSASPVCVPSFG